MRILVTNDDGIDSTGLHVLARAMCEHGDVVVAAPDREFSGAGAALGALNVIQPEVRRCTIDGVVDAWSVNGPPALCVMFSRLGAFGPRFDLVVSGINPGANVGRSVYHSGTVGACLTARSGGISGVAVSQAVEGYGVEGQGWDEMLRHQCWDAAAEVASAVVGTLVVDLPEEPVVVNLNVPNMPLAEMNGWRHAEVGVLPPRAMAEATLEPVTGHDGAFHVRMSWGEEISLAEGTDGGTIERDMIAISYLTRLVAEPRSDLEKADAALDNLFA